MRAGRAELRVVALSLLPMLPPGAAGACLPDAVPAAARRDVELSGRTSPLGVWPMAWDSSVLVAHVMAIIAEEELGYNVSVAPGGGYSFTAINALAGCPDPEDTDGCLEAPAPGATSWHLSFETWGNAEPVYERWRASGRSTAPSRIGSMGYIGSEGHFIKPAALARGLQEGDLALDWFRGFNASRGDPSRYFDPVLGLGRDSLMPCLWGIPSAFLETYFAHFQHGVAQVNGTYTPLCPENDLWWLSPACRGDLGRCLPYVADPGNYGTDTMMQQAVHWNMPIAIATTTTWDVFGDFVWNHNVMIYTWVPDSRFTGLNLREVMFPRYSSAEWKKGLKITNMDSLTLYKWAASGLDRAAPDAYAVASSLSVTLEAVQGMFEDLARGLTHREAACQWLRAHPEDWRSWLPDPLACLAGQGLVDAQGRVLEGLGGAARCEWCPPGRSSAALAGASRVCRRCGAGEFLDQPGQAKCKQCPAGSFTSGQGQTFCADCPVGRFSAGPGNSGCAACTKPHETTPFRSAKSRWECTCKEGYYRGSGHSEANGRHTDCGPCPGGMRCAGGDGEPALLSGFWANSGDSVARVYSVYSCRNSMECPGGLAGTCAQGREGVGCSGCKPDHHAVEGGRCERCQGNVGLPVALGSIGLVALLVLLAVFAQQDVTRVRMNVVAMCICLGQMVMVLQTLSLLRVLKVPWTEPFATFLRVTSVLNFEVSLIFNACMLPDSEVISKFVLTLLVFPTCTFILGAFFLFARAMGRAVNFDQFVNSIGVTCMLVFLPLTMASLEPFYCVGSPNGLATLQSDPAIVCYEGKEWPWLAVFGAIALLVYCVGFFSWTTWISLSYQRLVASRLGSIVMNRYRFIFQRFTVDCYFFTPICLARSLCIALVPIIFPDLGHRQVLVLVLVLCLFGFLHIRLQPWRGYVPNILDVIITLCLVMIMVCAGMLMDTNREVMMNDLVIFLVAATAMILAAILVVCVSLLFFRLRSRRGFVAFLCHHKAGCAVGARVMKLGLEERLRAPVFLDSDALDDLEDLLEIVRSSVQFLVVLLTAQTLSRPWCAGEIATAFSNGVPLVPVRYDDYVELTEDDLDEAQIGGRWPVEAFAGCAAEGVSLTNVKVAYAHLQGLKKIPCLRVKCCLESDLEASTRAIQKVAMTCLGRSLDDSNLDSPITAQKSISVTALASARSDLAVIASNTDAEAISAATVLSQLVRAQKAWTTLELLHAKDVDSVEDNMRPVLLVVLLTNGALTAHGFAQTLFAALERWRDHPNVVTVMMEGFVFPTGEAVAASIIPQVASDLCRAESEVAGVYGRLLSLLAKPFSPSGKISVLEAEVANIAMAGKCKAKTCMWITPEASTDWARRSAQPEGASKHQPEADAPVHGPPPLSADGKPKVWHPARPPVLQCEGDFPVDTDTVSAETVTVLM